MTGLFALAGALAIFGFPSLRDGEVEELRVERQPIVFNMEYRLYYLLSLLDGARQQIFFSFGLWVLIHEYGLTVPQISAVLLVTTATSIMVTPRIGRALDRYGERIVLRHVNIAFIVALAGYALVSNSVAATICYVIYTFIAPLAPMGATVYLRKIAPSYELAPSLAMGLTMQHAAAVVVPIVTGFILNFVGFQIPFLVGSGFAVVALFMTRLLDPANQKTRRKREEESARKSGVTTLQAEA
jgi:predicted MFS family arabinose efflux permease